MTNNKSSWMKTLGNSIFNKKVRLLSAGLILLLLTGGTANAQLFLEISDAGNGTTRWVFSGSTTIVSVNGGPSRGLDFRAPWTNGNPVSVSGATGVPSSELDGTISVNGVPGNVYLIVHTNNPNLHLYRRGNFSPQVNDLIEWSGDMLVNSPISNFNPGVYTSTTLVNCTISLPIILTIVGDTTVSREVNLVTNSNTLVGTVTTTGSGDGNWTVTYAMMDGWTLAATNLDLACDESEFPTTRRGNAQVFRFAHRGRHAPNTVEVSYEVTAPSCGCTFFAAHAVVVPPEGGRSQSAWGGGEDGINFPGPNFGMYFECGDCDP